MAQWGPLLRLAVALLALLQQAWALTDDASTLEVASLLNIRIAPNDDNIEGFLDRFGGDDTRFIRSGRGPATLNYTEPGLIRSLRIKFFALDNSFEDGSWSLGLSLGGAGEVARIGAQTDIRAADVQDTAAGPEVCPTTTYLSTMYPLCAFGPLACGPAKARPYASGHCRTRRAPLRLRPGARVGHCMTHS